MHRCLGGDVDSLGRFIENENLGLCSNPFGQNDFLLVAAREGLGIDMVAGRLDLHLVPMLQHIGFLSLGAGDHPLEGEKLEHRQGDVVRQAHLQHQTLLLPVFRNQGDALMHTLSRTFRHKSLALEIHGTFTGLVNAENGTDDLTAAGAHQAEQSQDLPFMQGEGDVLEGTELAQLLDLEYLLAENRGVLGIELVDRAADHHIDDLVLGTLLDLSFADILSVTEDGVIVTDGKNFIKFMGDEQNCFPALLEGADNAEEIFNLTSCEGAGRLIHDDQFGIEGERLGNLNHVPFGNAEVLDQRIRVDIQLHSSKQCLGLFGHCLPVKLLGLGITQMVPHENILGDAELGKHRGFLVNGYDSGLLGVDGVLEGDFLPF
ncbi:hypothetical protein SDC9_49285 [bioreactor metagenome]|uniref:NAD-specific glutamate dehydrogenase n=1 Tax=bioreactor metagenome TaxID=1076179 RepID=A0A644WGM6_9ZZZZ